MTAPPIRLIIVSLLAVGFALGLLPPAGGAGAPETVLESVALDEAGLAGPGLRASGQRLSAARSAWTPEREICAGFAFTGVGLTWEQEGGEVVPVNVRWRDAGGMRGVRTSGEPDHAPDPGTRERVRGGTPLVWTGETRCVEIALELPAGAEIQDLRAVFVNSSGTSHEGSVLGSIAAGLARGMARLWGMDPAEATAPKPKIISRSGWGADESLRRCGPSYAPALKMAYVHHTVTGNGYSKAKADDLIRGIYAYHTQGRGYCDIAYNFLVDRFGRIYEGRFGGITEPVIGGHAQGFNTGSTGVAVLGTFTSTNPSKAALGALEPRLLAWRLDVAHLNPKGTATMISAGGSNQKYEAGEAVKLPVIAGHRHTGYTSCPGDRLFAKLAAIRDGALARGLPKIWNVRATSDVLELGHEDVRYRAKLSSAIPWTVELAGPAGVVRSWSGTGDRIDVVWSGFDDRGFPVDEGEYTVTMRASDAGAEARPATLRTRMVGSCDITTTPSSPLAVGTDEDEVICGRNGQADTLDGGGGDDILIGFGGDDRLIGGPGSDTLIGGSGADVLQGGTAADVLFGGGGKDTLSGGGNADVLHGGPGDDQIDGGGGVDTVSYASSSSGVRVDLASGRATGEGTDTLTGISNVVGSPQADTLIGDAGANHLVGGGGRDALRGEGGDDLLQGGPGDDRLVGGPGDDTIAGGGGTDTVRFDGAPGPVSVDLRAGTAAGEGTDRIRGVQNVVGAPGKDVLRGDGKANRLVGKGGWDLLVGRGGPDVLVGGPGRDDLRGGPGPDTLRARDGKRDAVDGGGGRDTAFVDPKDAVRRVEQRR